MTFEGTMPMNRKILLIEDSDLDAELLVLHLTKSSTPLDVTRAATEAEFLAYLDASTPELILSDYNIGGLNALGVLAIVRRRIPDCPVIVVTGTLTDELAVECIKGGAIDYLLKDKLERLPLAVERALTEKQLVAERREAQRVLNHHAAIVSTSDDAIIGLTPDESIESWNTGAEALYGYTFQEAIGKPLSIVVPPEHRADLAQIHGVLYGGKVRNLETVHLRKDGSRASVSLTASPIKSPEGSALGVSVIVRDISEKKQLEQQYLHSQKMEAVGRLAGGVAHDFNNLLTVINGYADLVLQDLPAEEPMAKKLLAIKTAAQRAGGLTRQLLAFSRRQVLQPQVVNLNDAVRNVSAMLSRLIGENIELMTAFAGQVAPVKIDPGQLEQVILNLAVNAQDAMPRGGKLTIETRAVAEPPGAAIVMSDNGIGMNAETRSRIFEPFFTTKEAGKGTGLGLATVYGIVQQSGGTIGVTSEPGKGTTFRVWFPSVEAAPPAAETPRPAAPAHGTETILLVEDDDDVRLLTGMLLKQLGYTVIDAANTAQACSALNSQPVNLLLTDVIMPGGGAPEMSHVVLSARLGLPVLYMSGYTGDLLNRYGISGSEINFLEKPFTPDALSRKVRDTLEKGGLKRQNAS